MSGLLRGLGVFHDGQGAVAPGILVSAQRTVSAGRGDSPAERSRRAARTARQPVRLRICRRSRTASPGHRCGSPGILRGWESRSWRTRRPARPPASVDRPEGFADVNLWIDTRDTRNVSRATRFCHRFSSASDPGARSQGTGCRDQPATDRPCRGRRPDLLARRAEHARRADPSRLASGALSAGPGLHGFDPETNRRLGFAYQVSDHEREDQFLGVGRDFPLGENPSLWATLELQP